MIHDFCNTVHRSTKDEVWVKLSELGKELTGKPHAVEIQSRCDRLEEDNRMMRALIHRFIEGDGLDSWLGDMMDCYKSSTLT
jgi:hypothetical protein